MEVFFEEEEEGLRVFLYREILANFSADRGKFLETGTKLKSKNRSYQE